MKMNFDLRKLSVVAFLLLATNGLFAQDDMYFTKKTMKTTVEEPKYVPTPQEGYDSNADIIFVDNNGGIDVDIDEYNQRHVDRRFNLSRHSLCNSSHRVHRQWLVRSVLL